MGLGGLLGTCAVWLNGKRVVTPDRIVIGTSLAGFQSLLGLIHFWLLVVFSLFSHPLSHSLNNTLVSVGTLFKLITL
jgi:hypothetical protein